MRFKQSLKMAWLASGALLATGACTTGASDDQDRGPITMYAAAGTEDASALRGLAVDRRTYDALVHQFGSIPDGIELTRDAPDGTVQLLLAPSSPLIAGYLLDPAAVPPLSITFDDGTPQPVGLLLPAVQSIRDAAIHGDGTPTLPAGTLAITLQGEVQVGLLVPAIQKVREAAVDDRPATVVVRGTFAPGVAPEQRTMMVDAFVAPTGIDLARFAGADEELSVTELGIRDPYLLGRWTSAGAAMNLVVDVQLDGRVLTRFRVPRALPGTTTQAAHVKVFDGSTGLTRDGDAERAMFDVGYAMFSNDALDQARRLMLGYGGVTTMSQGISRWVAGRTKALGDIVVATGPGGAPGYEAMACAAALPTALAVASGLDLADADAASAIATVHEAMTTVIPQAGLVAGGELAMQTYGAAAPTGDAELACTAVHQLARLPQTAGTVEGVAIRKLALELDAFDARRLDVELVAWIDAMDAIVAAPDETAWAAARAKADILIEAFAAAATRTQVRWQMARDLLGR